MSKSRTSSFPLPSVHSTPWCAPRGSATSTASTSRPVGTGWSSTSRIWQLGSGHQNHEDTRRPARLHCLQHMEGGGWHVKTPWQGGRYFPLVKYNGERIWQRLPDGPLALDEKLRPKEKVKKCLGISLPESR